MTRWDEVALQVASLSREQFFAELKRAPRADQDTLLRMRLRWKVDEFGELVVKPFVERAGFRWHPNSPVNRELLDWQPRRFLDRSARTTQRLVWAPRGSSKTTTLKERTLHALVFGLEAGIIAIASGDTAASGFVNTIASWAADPSPMLKRLWPSFRITGSNEMRLSHVAGYAPIALHARGWTSTQIRGVNNDVARPTLLVLDDIESSATTSSQKVRDDAQDKLLTQVLGILPMEGGGEVWWSATPVHHDCISARAVGRRSGMKSWSIIRHKAVIRWPDRTDLWDACRKIFWDFDSGLDDEAREKAAEAFYLARKAEMDAGAEVLDPHRLPIFAAYMRLWSMTEVAFNREYQVDPKASSGRIFDSSAWTTYRWVTAGTITTGKRTIRVGELRIKAHWDPSDGGDAGGFAIVGREATGRKFVLHTMELQVKATDQIALIVAEVARWVDLGLSEVTYESNQLNSLVLKALNDAFTKAGLRVTLVGIHTSENKEQRLAGMEAEIGCGGLVFDAAMPAAHRGEFDDFNPARKDNRDNVMDAVQRAAERCGKIIGQLGKNPIGG